MSTPEPRKTFRWPLSIVNTVIYAYALVFGVGLIVFDRVAAGVVMIVAAVLGVLFSIRARRSGSGDLERVNALELADERDRAAARKAFAAIGVVALVAAMLQFTVAIIVDEPAFALVSAIMLLILTVTWMIANWYYVRRG